MGVANFRSIANYQFKFQRGYYPIGKSQTEIYLPFRAKQPQIMIRIDQEAIQKVKKGLCV